MDSPRIRLCSLLTLAMVLWIGHTAHGSPIERTSSTNTTSSRISSSSSSSSTETATPVPDQCQRYEGVDLIGGSGTSRKFVMIYALRDFSNDFHYKHPDVTLSVGESPTDPLTATARCDLNNIFIRHRIGRGTKKIDVALESFRHPGWFVTSSYINDTCNSSRQLTLFKAIEAWTRPRHRRTPLPANATIFTFKTKRARNVSLGCGSSIHDRMEYSVNETGEVTGRKFSVGFDLGHDLGRNALPVRARLSNSSASHSPSSCSTTEVIETLSLRQLCSSELSDTYNRNSTRMCRDIKAKQYVGQCFEKCLFCLDNHYRCSPGCSARA